MSPESGASPANRAISEHTGIRYWSTTRKRWQVLIIESHALRDATAIDDAKTSPPTK